MNYPPIFAAASQSAAVKALLGSKPLRLYLFGEADQNTAKPYAVWQTVYGSPENYLNQVPDTDSWGVQVDVYAEDKLGERSAKARAVAAALTGALEPDAYVVAYNGESKEVETKLYRYSFTVEFINYRGNPA